MTAAPKNPQNDRLYVPASIRKKDVAAKRLLRTRSTFSQSLMVSVGVSKLGRTGLIFVEPGVKVNGTYYRNVLQHGMVISETGVLQLQHNYAAGHTSYRWRVLHISAGQFSSAPSS